ncbi:MULTISPECIES: D-alanyl-D-alanine carboxypeptidase [Kitasatospora]|uniref:Putative peptidase S11 family protein n=2 Tax=Kitasatospora setae TaxID=2066 RepID=E4N435_KITSK|nr:D-alanyl-D-alanine carboxypeptidase [Kitasatospora setae]BAJ25966.1 putative peptidase S11 family protein [Kitasatospora setae KM-6054]
MAAAVGVVAVLVGGGGCAAPGADAGAGAGVGGIDLPWPGEGQSSVVVEGFGSLGGRGGSTPVPIASVTKVMTAYVILRGHPLEDGGQGPRIGVDAAAARESFAPGESTAQLREGQDLTERQLLELMLLPSGNNVARLLARWDSGSQEAFVVKMNRAALELGMTRTTYTGASGLEESTRSTAEDQIRLARAAMGLPVLREVVGMRETTVAGVPGTVVNTNTLLGRDGVIGLKTGSTTAAGGNLMWAAEVRAGGGVRLVLGVVLAQRANTTPQQGLAAALERSGRLIEAVREQLPGVLAAGDGNGEGAAAAGGRGGRP